jgi:transcriptional regulator with XRE-family HTH domain
MAAPVATGGEEVFGDWLRGRLRQIDSSPVQLARHLGTTTVEVEAWLAGRRAPTAAQCERIGSLLGVPARQVRRLAGVGAAATLGTSDPPAVAPRTSERAAVERPSNTDDQRMVMAPLLDEREALIPPTKPIVVGSGLAVAATVDAASGPGETSTLAVTPPAEPPVRPSRPRPRRERPTPEPVEPPIPPAPLIRPEQVAALRALADELVEAERAYAELRAEIEHLRAERARLEAENVRLRDRRSACRRSRREASR